jgi:sulfate permease, SulP family
MMSVVNEKAPLLGGIGKTRLSVCTDEESLVPAPYKYRSLDSKNHGASTVCREPRVLGSTQSVIGSNWGATPSMRKIWTEMRRFDTSSELERESIELPCQEPPAASPSSVFEFSLEKLVGLMIALMLNLFLSMSFGQAFFPADWDFSASHVPREIGVQMFLFSTLLCQFVMTSASDFPCAMGMMMVENIPFMHTIAVHVQHRHGCGAVGTATVLASFAVSSVVVGVFFWILGAFKLGNAVYFFPKHVILGCIGGVGMFVVKTGLEVSTNLTLTLNHADLVAFTSAAVVPLWLVSCAYDIGLRMLNARFQISILPPLYFVLIPPTFYFFLWMCGETIETAHSNHWFFESSGHEEQDPFLIWELLKLDHVHWGTIAEMAPTIIALTIFSLMHVPINIPSLSVSTKVIVDMNKELRAHGMSNILVGLLGGCQNYTCYSNS